LLPFIVLLFGGLSIEAASFMKASDAIVFILLFPVVEELFKWLVARNIERHPFAIIAIFGFCEFLLFKVPLASKERYLYIPLLFMALPALVFHLASGYAYTKSGLSPNTTLFVVMLGTHVAFNSLDMFVSDYTTLIVFSFILAALPLLSRYARVSQ